MSRSIIDDALDNFRGRAVTFWDCECESMPCEHSDAEYSARQALVHLYTGFAQTAAIAREEAEAALEALSLLAVKGEVTKLRDRDILELKFQIDGFAFRQSKMPMLDHALTRIRAEFQKALGSVVGR